MVLILIKCILICQQDDTSSGLFNLDEMNLKKYGINIKKIRITNGTETQISKIYDETVGTLKGILEEEKNNCENDNE